MDLRRTLIILAVPVVLVLGACAAEASDPMVSCIDVSVEYGVAADRSEASEICVWLQDHEARLGGATFEETFTDSDLAREWAKSELEKSN
jgi:hypothetical protein